ncbi:MAG: hypothetical protein R3E79_30825 [Caldilineaceae bacterium]
MTKVWFSTTSERQATRFAGVAQLFLNHLDAWSVTGFIGAVALLAHDALTWSSGLLLGSLMVSYRQAFVLNDYFEAPFDRTDRQKARYNFFIHHPQRIGTLLAVLLPVDLIVAWGFLQYGWRGLAVMIICLAVMWAYSAPPLAFGSIQRRTVNRWVGRCWPS